MKHILKQFQVNFLLKNGFRLKKMFDCQFEFVPSEAKSYRHSLINFWKDNNFQYSLTYVYGE